jgi:hypothetical protein
VTVWKFPLRIEALQGVPMPEGAEILHVAEQTGLLCMWALVDPDAQYAVRTFAITGTGHLAPDKATHVASAVMADSFVWHVFEVPA